MTGRDRPLMVLLPGGHHPAAAEQFYTRIFAAGCPICHAKPRQPCRIRIEVVSENAAGIRLHPRRYHHRRAYDATHEKTPA